MQGTQLHATAAAAAAACHRLASAPSPLQLEPLERAQAQLALAGAAQRLLELFLRASGVDPESHESRKERVRCGEGLSAAVAWYGGTAAP